MESLIFRATEKPSTIRLTSVHCICNIIHWLHNNLSDSIDLLSKITPILQNLKQKLSIPLRQEELFLEVFEDEYKNIFKFPSLGQLIADTSLGWEMRFSTGLK